MNIKKEKTLEYLPDYLKDNEYFSYLLAKVTLPVNSLQMIKNRCGYYFFTQFNPAVEEYFPVSIAISNKGIVEFSSEEEKIEIVNGVTFVNKNYNSVYSIREQDGNYSISRRYTVVPFNYIDFTAEKIQNFEKRIYDSHGNLKRKIIKKYLPQETDANLDECMKWDKNFPYESVYHYYYLSQDDAIVKEQNFSIAKTSHYYVTYKNKEENKTEISEEIFSRYLSKFYDDLYDSKYIEHNSTKKLKKSFI